MECMKDHFRNGQLLDGRFRTIAPLNHGSFGMVFLAEDLVTRQEVAIKCLTKPEAAPSTTQPSEDSIEELECHAILKRHEHLVNLIHQFETPAHTYLVLEYCSQGDLYEAIRVGRGPLETEHVRRFILQLISAVEHMHSVGLYHRDIKPENIFLLPDGSMKLGDFGLATRNTRSFEACVGSDRYMAPEQYDPSNTGYSPAKADIWSIGICLLNVLFSRNPFVTPTDSDILFADYRRDRQSLFDIFPSMSQDTFEILSIAMAMDPSKRDLKAVRQAVLRTLTFTTDDDNDDEFCAEERDVLRASANREPLRTPSIQSPQMDGDTFPWAKALHSSPPRQLSAIPDTETYDEDLFESEKNLRLGESWFSGHANTPSMASVLDSAYGSIKSMAIRPSVTQIRLPESRAFPQSLPARPSRPIPTMSSVFGKKGDTVAKSWSDMFEEDDDDWTREEAVLQERRENNARSWSQESQNKQAPVRPGILTEAKPNSFSNSSRSRTPRPISPIKTSFSPNENDSFSTRPKTPRRSPKQVPADKWAALGNKRRNHQTENVMLASASKKHSVKSVSRKKSGEYDNRNTSRWGNRSKARPAYLDQDWRQPKSVEHSPEEDDHEWVGGWHNFHL